jgi:hypothetical protein
MRLPKSWSTIIRILVIKKPIVPDQEMLNDPNFYEKMDSRRSVRAAFDRPKKSDRNIIKTASLSVRCTQATLDFCVVANPEIKTKIRSLLKKKSKLWIPYVKDWLDDLKPLVTDWRKSKSPYLIIVFGRIYEFGDDGQKKNNYYVQESVGLATGFLLAVHTRCRFSFLTHTLARWILLVKY